MGRAYLLIVVGMGLLSAMCSRAGDRTVTSGGPTEYRFDGESSGGDQEPATTISDGSSTSLERSGDGHFYADVEINGTSIRMLVDTGASGIALSREDARRAGIATSISMPNVVGEGASGEVRGEAVTIDRMSLGGAKAERVGAVVLDSGGMSLLGQDFLRQFASVEIKDDRMVLR